MNILDIDPANPVMAGKMITFSGQIVNLFDPDPDTIFLEDIAHGLAYNFRWNGHSKLPYTIAEHCIRVDDAMYSNTGIGLFHDAEEAYW